MKIEIEPKDIKFKVQVKKGEFRDMIGSLVRIKNHEVGVGPRRAKEGCYLTMTDLRTGVMLYKFPLNFIEVGLASTRELAMEMYEYQMNLLDEESYDYIFKKADETLDKYAAAPAYEVFEVTK